MEKDFDPHHESDVAGFLGIYKKKEKRWDDQILQIGPIDWIILALGLDDSKINHSCGCKTTSKRQKRQTLT